MIHHLNRAAGLCLTAALLLTAAGCGQQTVPESPSPSPVVKTAAADKNDLTVVRSMELQYANNFAVDYCANGCKIITDGAGQKFLWVPEGGEAPDDTGDMTVLQAPLTKLGCFSTTHATLFHAIGALDKVSLVTTDKDKWHIERFIGVITEHFAGAFPTWLAPVQVKVLPITDRAAEYADQVAARLDALGYRVETDHRSEKIGFKIRQAQLEKVPYMLVVGGKEAETGDVAVRNRHGEQTVMSFDAFAAKLRDEVDSKALEQN